MSQFGRSSDQNIKRVQMTTDELLHRICIAIHATEAKAFEGRRKAIIGDQVGLGFLVMREDKVRVEIRKESTGHNEPHLHVSHSDKIDASISLLTFRVLAGKIDRRTLKYFLKTLRPKRAALLKIWEELNEKENSVAAEELISNLDLGSSG
jgi:hypothetical protein